MLRRLLLVSQQQQSIRTVAAVSRTIRRSYFDDKRLDVLKKAKPPSFDFVEPFVPAVRAPRKPLIVVSNLPPLDKPLTGIELVDKDALMHRKVARSQLVNDVRVVSCDVASNGFVVIGVAVEVGSRFENEAERGSTVVAHRMAFTSAEFKRKIGALNIFSVESREFVVFIADVPVDNAEAALSIIAEHICTPNLDPTYFDTVKQGLLHQIDELHTKANELIPELLHTVAFAGAASASHDGGVARPQLCSANELEKLSLSTVESFLKRRYVGENVTIVGTGIDHTRLHSLAERYLGALPARSTTSGTTTATPAVYRGGTHTLLQGADNDDNKTHVAFAVRGAGIDSDDLYLACLFQQLLGGGDSFSSGGPGKGMHSILYRNVLSQYGNVDSAIAFNHMYKGGGLIGIYVAVRDCDARVAVEGLILPILTSLAHSIDDEAFRRARQQLKARLLMNLESRLVVFEDITRQTLATNSQQPVDVKRIESLTAEQLSEFIAQRLREPPTLLAFGPENRVASTPNDAQLRQMIDHSLNQ